MPREAPSVELRIFGKGFGESIVLAWSASDGCRRGVLIDGFDWGGSKWIAKTLKNEMGIDRLALVVATHPHLDHVESLGKLIGEFGWSCVDRFWWWGGLDQHMVEARYRRIQKRRGSSHLGSTATAVCDLFHEMKLAILDGESVPVPEVPQLDEWEEIDELENGDQIRILAFSPRETSSFRFTEQLMASYYNKRNTEPNANLVSLGLIVEFGDAQLVLGGDVESRNWRDATEAGKMPSIRPSVVKISHHASKTGMMDKMWLPDSGFFGGGERTASPAVATPWRIGSRRKSLPDPAVLEAIAKSGHEVYVVATQWENEEMVIYPKEGVLLKGPPPHVSVIVHSDGSVAEPIACQGSIRYPLL